MDIFKEKRYLWFTIIVLIVMNLAVLTLLWLGRPEAGGMHGPPKNPAEQRERLQHLLAEELGFDNSQIEQYLKLRRDHQHKMRLLQKEVREIKREMFDEVLEGDLQTELSDSLLALAQDKQAQIEHLTVLHFIDLKKLCKSEQREKLKLLMHEILRPAPPPRRNADRPPLPGGGERQPPPPEYE